MAHNAVEGIYKKVVVSYLKITALPLVEKLRITKKVRLFVI
jgi:hypothetical protein